MTYQNLPQQPRPPVTPNYQSPPVTGGGIGALIPYKNTCALISYYLGVFSLIPCVGALLGIAAVILGIIGLRKAARFPEAKGKVHAIVGIVCGGIFGLVWLVAIIFVFIGIVTESTRP